MFVYFFLYTKVFRNLYVITLNATLTAATPFYRYFHLILTPLFLLTYSAQLYSADRKFYLVHNKCFELSCSDFSFCVFLLALFNL